MPLERQCRKTLYCTNTLLGSKSRDRKRTAEVSMGDCDQCISYRVTFFAAMQLSPSRLNSRIGGAVISPSDGTFSRSF